MYLHAIEPGPLSAVRRRDEVLRELLDLAGFEGARTRLRIFRRPDRSATDKIGRRAQARVVQLH